MATVDKPARTLMDMYEAAQSAEWKSSPWYIHGDENADGSDTITMPLAARPGASTVSR